MLGVQRKWVGRPRRAVPRMPRHGPVGGSTQAATAVTPLPRPWMNRATSLPSPRPRAQDSPRLSRDVLLASDRFIYESSSRLSPADSQFARGVAQLLREGRRLTSKQVTRLVLLTANL